MFNKAKALNNLKDLKTIFEQLGVKYWLTDGTLLGLHREGDFLDHDLDTDIGLMIDDYSPLLVKTIALYGFTLHRVFGEMDNGLEIAIKRGGVKTDLFFYYKEGSDLVHSSWDFKEKAWHQIKYRYPAATILPVQQTTFKGMSFNVPRMVVNFLATKYGNFKEVITEWDWRFGPENAEGTAFTMADNEPTDKRIRAAWDWDLQSSVTILIKTFHRRDCLNNLVESIRHYYPKIKMVIVDDSGEGIINLPCVHNENTALYYMPFDSGLSACRNLGVSKINTPFFILCDDDFEFCDETNVTRLLEVYLRSGLDIMGGVIEEKGELMDYYGNLLVDFESKTLTYDKTVKEHGEYNTCEMILNFFVARTADVRNNPWDNDLKLAEHTAFFYSIKGILKVGYTHLVKCLHKPVRNGHYIKYRLRGREFFQLWMHRKGLKNVVNFKGEMIGL